MNPFSVGGQVQETFINNLELVSFVEALFTICGSTEKNSECVHECIYVFVGRLEVRGAKGNTEPKEGFVLVR